MKRPSILIISIVLILSIIVSNLQGYEEAFANSDDDLVVSSETLHLREGPGLSYPIVKTLKKDDRLTFIEREGEWYHVQVDDLDGWVASWLTSPTNTEQQQVSEKTAISQVDQLNVRSEPSLSSSVLTQIHTGQEVKVLDSKNNWVKISFNEYVGWVSADYVTVNEIESKNNVETEEKDSNSQTTTNEDVSHDENTFTIVVDEVIVRKKANLSSRPIGSVKKGEQYEVLDRHHNWVKIKVNKKSGWLYNFYGTFTAFEKPLITNDQETSTSSKSKEELIKIIYNGTNIREKPSTKSNVVFRADAGETYKVVNVVDDWYEIKVNDQTKGYVANWVVSTSADTIVTIEPKKEKRKKGTLNGVTIVVDPGHGGNDHGTIGVRGTDEKEVNLKTAELLISKLKAAGATVISTRESDVYVDLRKRVSISHQYAADAFISLHYDATEDSSITGITTYYTKSFQKPLADFVHEGLANKVDIRDRGVQSSNLLVLRENKQNAILIELGFLSNPNEERIVTTDYYREQATLGIYEGILNYFDHLLEK